MAATSGRTWLVRGTIAAVVLVALGFGAVFLYAKVINDGPDAFDDDDLAAKLTATSLPVATSTTPPLPTVPAVTVADTSVTTTVAPATTTAPAAGPSGWTIAEGSEVGYRVVEVLVGVDTEGVGRTTQVTGALTIDGTVLTDASFEVDVASISSDDGRRDGAFRGPIMRAETYPTATFTLTQPLDLGTEPVDGAEVAVTAHGELTLREVTRAVDVELTGRMENGRIGVLGSIPVVFADYGIDNPSTAMVTTHDDGLLEFVLVFTPT